MTEGLESVPETELGVSPERWISSNRAVITSGDGRLRSVDVNPALRPVLTEQGKRIGQVLELTVEANPGDQQASLEFTFKKDPQGIYNPLTSGWQTWSSSVVVGEYGDRLVGMNSYNNSLGGKTVPFFEPGQGKEKIPDKEGRSYGWVCFRDMKGGENVALGVIPGFDAMESIRFRQEGDNIVVSVTKDLEGVLSKRPVSFRVFLGSGYPPKKIPGQERTPGNYADLMQAFSTELSKRAGVLPLMQDRAIGFSWPGHGLEINQAIIQKEIEAGQGIIDTYIIDGGWETADGSLIADKRKFPNLPALAQSMKAAGIKPGIWTCPFRVGQNGLNLPSEWFMKDEKGRPKRIDLPNPMGFLERYVAKTLALDVSVPEARAYLAERFLDLAKMGFEVFKVDYISVPFTGRLQNRDKTSVEYYRQTFEEIRQHIRDELGKEIELIGCGAPMMESIGLFNGIRMTADSALPNLEGMPIIGRLVSFLKKIPRLSQEYSKTNTRLYLDAVAVAARRTLLFKGSHGLLLDGIHLADKDVPLDPDKRDRLNQSLLALNSLGIGNLFVGDSLFRVGEEGRKVWRSFISKFKT